MSWRITFKGKEPMDCIIAYSLVTNTLSEYDLIKKQDREVLQIHFDSKMDASELTSIYQNEDVLSEVTVEDIENNQFYVYVGYVIPNSLTLTTVDGVQRWIMEIAQLTEVNVAQAELIRQISNESNTLHQTSARIEKMAGEV